MNLISAALQQKPKEKLFLSGVPRHSPPHTPTQWFETPPLRLASVIPTDNFPPNSVIINIMLKFT